MTTRTVIKLRTIHHPEHRLAQRLQPIKDFDVQQACLLKYFPKYYRHLDLQKLPTKKDSIISKLRQIKAIENFSCYELEQIPKKPSEKVVSAFEQKIFRNKRKLLKSVPIFEKEKKEWWLRTRNTNPPQVSNFFPRINSLDLTKIPQCNQDHHKTTFVNRRQEQEIFRRYSHFWGGFRHLKHLTLSSGNYFLWLILKEINRSPHLLSSLETLKLTLTLSHDNTNNAYPRNLLSEISRNEEFLKHITHLDCKKFEGFQYYDELMSMILAQCHRLVALKIPIGREANYWNDIEEIYLEPKDAGVLEQLEKMENLERLEVNVAGWKSFIKHFTVPSSLRKMVLKVRHSFYDHEYFDFLEDPEIEPDGPESNKFFQRWRNLPHLHTLKIRMRRTNKSNELVRRFVVPILEGLPGLEKFRLKLVSSPAYDKCDAVDLSLLLENSAVLKQVKYFKIQNLFIDFDPTGEKDKPLIKFDPNKSQHLSNLTRVKFCAKFNEEFNIKEFLKLFASGPSEPKKNLKLKTVHFESVENFSECLKIINREARLRNMRFDLSFDVNVQSFDEIFNHFTNPVILEKGVTIELRFYVVFPKDSPTIYKIPEEYREIFNRVFGGFNSKVYQVIPNGPHTRDCLLE